MDTKVREFKSGMSFKAIIPFSFKPMKVHIDHVLPSIYEGEKLIIYRVFGTHKRWWHQFMCTDSEMSLYRTLNDDK